MGNFDYRTAAQEVNRVRWETNYPSKEEACWAYQNAIRTMMRNIADFLQDSVEGRVEFKRIETGKAILFVAGNRVVIRCDWVGYGLSGEMFEIYIADSKEAVDNYIAEFANNSDVFPNETNFAYVAYDATPEDVVDFLDITDGEKDEVRPRLKEWYQRKNIHSRMKSNDPSLIELWIDVVHKLITIPT